MRFYFARQRRRYFTATTKLKTKKYKKPQKELLIIMMIVTNFVILYLLQGNNISQQAHNVVPKDYKYNLSVLNSINEEDLGLGKEDKVLIISRLGTEENFKYNERRLYTVRSFFKKRLGLLENKVVTVIGEPINGYGVLEFYVKGRKYAVLTVDKNQELWITEKHDLSLYCYMPDSKAYQNKR